MNNQNYLSRNRRKPGGFTLIEILVVMVLIGILAAMIMPSFSSEARLNRELEIEAKRLHLLLRMAADEALFSGTEIGVVAEEESYAFYKYDYRKEEWVAFEDKAFKQRSLPDDMVMLLTVDGEAFDLAKDTESDASSENSFENSASEKDVISPNLFFLSSGDVTPFTLTLAYDLDNTDQIGVFELKTDGFEEIQLHAAEAS